MQWHSRNESSKSKYSKLKHELSEFMDYKELPPALKTRVMQFIEFKFQKNYFKESLMWNSLSSVIKEDIMLHSCKDMVEKVDFFREVPSDLIVKLVSKLRLEVFQPGDVVVEAGVPGAAMYFIYFGSVAVYAKTGVEVSLF